jgi:hypothetical protein
MNAVALAVLLALQSPGQVTNLTATTLDDTAVVLTWREVASGTSAIAKYVIRVGPIGFAWGATPNVATGGCGHPVYGSTVAGGRVRSCVLGGLQPHTAYDVQLVAYRGTLFLDAIFGALSNRARAITAERVGPLIVLRPRLNPQDSIYVSAASISLYAATEVFPLRGWVHVGSHYITGFDVADNVVARGYLLVVRP